MTKSIACKRSMAILFITIGFITIAITSPAASVSLTGDSTVTSASGWGGKLIEFLPFGVSVKNKAISGTSTKSFIDQGYWQTTVDLDCDYVFIQFGHNDQKLSDTARGAYPIELRPAGVTPRICDMFRTNLVKMVEDVQDQGGTLVLVTPLARRGRVVDSYGVLQFQNDVPVTSYSDAWGNSYSLLDYADAAKAVATQKGIPCVDLNQLSLDLYNQMLDDGEDITTLGPDGDQSTMENA